VDWKKGFYLDFGVEYGLPSESLTNLGTDQYIGYTTLPRACCLEQLIRDLHPVIDDIESRPLKVTRYSWGLTKDVTAITIETSATHDFRKFGLCFIQFYPSCKNQFDSGGYYPYPEDDDSGVALVLDDHTLNALYSKVGRQIPERSTCLKSWRCSGRRLSTDLASHGDRSYHMRMEIRMTPELKDEVDFEIMSRRIRLRNARIISRDDTSRGYEMGCLFYVYTTRVINDFVTASTQPIARLYQEVISLSPEGKLGIDHQKIAIQLFKLQKVSYSASNLSKENYLWKEKIRVQRNVRERLAEGEGLYEERGLGLSKTIQQYGYGYPLHGLLDWRMLNFMSAEIAEAFPHPSRAVANIVARPMDTQRLKTVLQEVDFIAGRLCMEKDQKIRSAQLDWLATRLIVQYHTDLTVEIIRSPLSYPNKQDHLLEKADEEEDPVREEMVEEQDVSDFHSDREV
jgi:hypothetical protein